MGFEGISWSQVGFYSFRPVLHGSLWFFMVFMVPGLVFMIPGEFLSPLMVPGWFKSELSGFKLN